MYVKHAIKHFIEFHKGTLNIILHIVGFAAIGYSIYALNWTLFAIGFVVLEAGHVYNHFAGIKKYDFRLKVLFWRLIIFLAVVGAFYWIIKA